MDEPHQLLCRLTSGRYDGGTIRASSIRFYRIDASIESCRTPTLCGLQVIGLCRTWAIAADEGQGTEGRFRYDYTLPPAYDGDDVSHTQISSTINATHY